MALHEALNAVRWSDAESRPRFSPEAVNTLIAKARNAQKEGDANAFRVHARALGAANDPDGDAYLASVIADESIPLNHTFALTLSEALKDSEVEGLAALARKRYERGVTEGQTSWTGAAGWFDMIAAHGNADDVKYLISRPRHRHHAEQALAHVRDDASIDAVVELIRSGSLNKSAVAFQMVCQRRPEAAFALAEEALRASESGLPSDLSLDPRDVVRVLGRFGPSGQLDRIKNVLLVPTKPATRIEAVYGAQQLAKRKLDVSGLERLIDFPRQYLLSVARGNDARYARAAAYAIEYNQVTWNDDAVAVLREVAQVLGKREYKKTAREVEAHMKSPWK